MHLIKICRARRAKRKTNSNFCHGFRSALPLPFSSLPRLSWLIDICAVSRCRQFWFLWLASVSYRKKKPNHEKKQKATETEPPMLERDSCPNGRWIQSKCKCSHCATQDNRSARAEQRQQLQQQQLCHWCWLTNCSEVQRRVKGEEEC